MRSSTELGIDFIKWDHNRDLVESVHDGRPGVHAQMHAVYRLIAELKRRHPGLEIESCSSGGARTDLGIMAVCDRVWASDSNDPVERQDIQRWTGPAASARARRGARRARPSRTAPGRTTDLSYRMATSLMGSAGFEWDISRLRRRRDWRRSRAFAELYRSCGRSSTRGTVVHPDLRDPAWRVTGFVAPTTARPRVYVVATVASLEDARAERLRLPGLDPERRYRVRVRREIGDAKHGWIAPSGSGPARSRSRGPCSSAWACSCPTLWPVQAFVLHVTAA